MKRPRKLILACTLVGLIGALAVGQAVLSTAVSSQEGNGVMAPRFEVDPLWPKPLPNGWVYGTVIGVGVDSRDYVYIIHRQNINPQTEGGADQNPPIAQCCRAAPPVVVFDPEGNMVDAWGGPGEGYDWPQSNHGLQIDQYDNVWIGGNGAQDSHFLQFTRDGQFVQQYGRPGQAANSNAMDHFSRPAKITPDPLSDDVYVSDGYGNKRVAVVDRNSGQIVRYWGAYGNRPDDAAPMHPRGAGFANQPADLQFRPPVHCADPSLDRLVYVCDRQNNRLQVFQTDGTFVKEEFYSRGTLGDGSTWDVAFSRDPGQRYLYLADGKNMRVRILDRESLAELTTFGTGGRQPGAFFAVHSLDTDSQGNIYTTETYEGRRLQKFVYRGIAPVTQRDQGVVWPTRR